VYLPQSNQVEGLQKREDEALGEMCKFAKSLYKVGLYSLRQYFFAEDRYVRYESNYQVVHDNESDAWLQAGGGQQILTGVQRSFRYCFDLLKKANSGEYRYHGVRVPRSLEKDGYFPLIFSTNAIAIQDGYVQGPMSRQFHRLHPDWERIRIPFPSRLEAETIKDVRILPVEKARAFRVQFFYEPLQEAQPTLSPDKALAIDLGLDNLGTCVNCTGGASFLIDGKDLQSINHQYTVRLAILQSILNQEKLPWSKQVAKLTKARPHQVHDYMTKFARYVVHYGVSREKGTSIVGYHPDWKREINISTQHNQDFVERPHGQLLNPLENLDERDDIQYVEQEESHTSPASFLDEDDIPGGNETHQEVTFSGKQGKRGRYRASKSRMVNADGHGAGNILPKSNYRCFDGERVASGLLANRLRVQLTEVGFSQEFLASRREESQANTWVAVDSTSQRIWRCLG